MKDETFTINFNGQELQISGKVRRGSENLLFALHGLGCTKDSFSSIFDCDALQEFSIICIDLIGFGDSSRPRNFSYRMEDHATCCKLVLAQQSVKKVHIIGHSMGGSIGILVAEKLGERMGAFINVEGNLVSEDCSLLSRRTIAIPYDQFKGGFFQGLKAGFRKSEYEGLRLWAKWVEESDAFAFYQSSKSLVEWSDSGELMKRFMALEAPKVFFHGQRNSGLPVIDKLGAIKKVSISDSGHFIMNDNPEGFYSEVARILKKYG